MSLAALLALGIGGIAILWTSTPSAGDLELRVERIALAAGQPVLTPESLTRTLTDAVVATEDERFFSHHGIDTLGLLRAAWDDLGSRCLCEGGSTITQQLADVVYFQSSDRLGRKLPSMIVALRIEARLPKRRILADYLTVVPTGRGLVGARAAACAYFGRDLDRLDLAQAAEIAGMPQAPSAYDPRYAPEAARARRDVVLARMAAGGYVSPAAARAAMTEPVLASGPGCAGR